MAMRHDHDQYLRREDLLTHIHSHMDRIYSLLIWTIMVLYILDGGHRLGCGLN